MLDALFVLGETIGGSLLKPEEQFLEFLTEELVEDLDEGVETALETLADYLQFLHETGRWQGDEPDYDDSLEVVYGTLMESATPMTTLDVMLSGVTRPDETGRIEGVSTAVIISAVPQLLAWMGRSRPITGTGSLRLSDIETVAALLGVPARGSRARAPFEPLDFDDLDNIDGVEIVQSMWHVIELGAWWRALLEVGVVETTVTTVRRGPAASGFESGLSADSLRAAERIVEHFVREIVADTFSPQFGIALFAQRQGMDLLAHLVLAMRPDIMPEAPADDVLSGFAFPLASMFGAPTKRMLLRLTRLGVLTHEERDTGVRFVVPEGLRPAVAGGARAGLRDAGV